MGEWWSLKLFFKYSKQSNNPMEENPTKIALEKRALEVGVGVVVLVTCFKIEFIIDVMLAHN